jgi:hypothetical protein
MACLTTDAVFEGAGVGLVTGGAFRSEGLLGGQLGGRQSVRSLLPGLEQETMTGAARLAAEHGEARVGSGYSSKSFAELLGCPEPGQDSENHRQARVYALSAR